MDWRERIDLQLLQSSSRLIFLCAKALLFSGRLDEAETCLQRLRHFCPLPDQKRHRRLLASWQALNGTLHGFVATLNRRACIATPAFVT
jgi:ATP/maltotriose-dependent transcriptional regulator MalT